MNRRRAQGDGRVKILGDLGGLAGAFRLESSASGFGGFRLGVLGFRIPVNKSCMACSVHNSGTIGIDEALIK